MAGYLIFLNHDVCRVCLPGFGAEGARFTASCLARRGIGGGRFCGSFPACTLPGLIGASAGDDRERQSKRQPIPRQATQQPCPLQAGKGGADFFLAGCRDLHPGSAWRVGLAVGA